jgi:hypothetical protein
MIAIFADTSFYIGLASARDQYHLAAHRILSTHLSGYVTTTAVLLEVGNFLASRQSRAAFTRLIRILSSSDQVEIVAIEDELWSRGLELYAARTDKDWSLTDCLSFLVMDRKKIREAATSDHHFHQAGFEVLMSP